MGAGAPISWMERQTDQLIDGQTYPRVVCKLKQVTRGHNIVTDGWAGAPNPNPHLKPSQPKHILKKYLPGVQSGLGKSIKLLLSDASSH